MPTQLSPIRSDLLRTVLSLLLLAMGLLQCGGEPILVLNIDPGSLPGSVTKLLVRTSLNGTAGRGELFDVGPRGIAVHLPEGASGQVQIDLFGLNDGGCKVAQTSWTQDVPGGLSRSAERAVTLTELPVPLCTLTVFIDSGSGRVTSSPTGIDCGDTGNQVCTAEYSAGVLVQLTASTASTAARSYPTWSGACSGPADGCAVPLAATQQVHVTFAPRICSPDGWCWAKSPPARQYFIRSHANRRHQRDCCR